MNEQIDNAQKHLTFARAYKHLLDTRAHYQGLAGLYVDLFNSLKQVCTRLEILEYQYRAEKFAGLVRDMDARIAEFERQAETLPDW